VWRACSTTGVPLTMTVVRLPSDSGAIGVRGEVLEVGRIEDRDVRA